MYKEVLHNISIFEKKKSRNQDRIRTLEKENSRLSDELKKLYNLKNQFEEIEYRSIQSDHRQKGVFSKRKLKNFIQSFFRNVFSL